MKVQLYFLFDVFIHINIKCFILFIEFPTILATRLEVEQSSWVEELKKMNAVHPYHKDSLFDKYRHFIFFFHDTCFEIVCESFDIFTNSESTMQQEIKRISLLI